MDALHEPIQLRRLETLLYGIGPVCINGAPDALISVASGNEGIAEVLSEHLDRSVEQAGEKKYELVSAVIVPVKNEACHSLRVLDARRCRRHPQLGYLPVPYAAALAVSLENDLGLVEEIQTKLRLHTLFFARAPHQDHVPIIQVGQTGDAGVYGWGMRGDPCGSIGLVYRGSLGRVKEISID